MALAAVGVLSTPLAPAPVFAKADCRVPRDYAELVHCFLAQFRCLPSYFGIDGTPDYPKALNCFESNNLWVFVALMYIDGEGKPRDLQKAEAALKAWKQNGGDEFNRAQAATLENAINRCKRRPRESCSRVDYCKELAENTLEIEICDGVEQLSDETKLGRAIAQARNKMSLADRALFDQAVTEFKAYQLQDMQRQYDASINASLRDLAGAGQAAFVRQNFLKLMAETIHAHKLEPALTGAYQAANAELARVYSSNVQGTIKYWQEGLQDARAKDLWDQDRSHIRDYKRAAQESQVQWIKFRDSCAELASSLYRGQSKEFDPAVSMKNAVTKLRIAELLNDPLAPEPD